MMASFLCREKHTVISASWSEPLNLQIAFSDLRRWFGAFSPLRACDASPLVMLYFAPVGNGSFISTGKHYTSTRLLSHGPAPPHSVGPFGDFFKSWWQEVSEEVAPVGLCVYYHVFSLMVLRWGYPASPGFRAGFKGRFRAKKLSETLMGGEAITAGRGPEPSFAACIPV